MQSSQFQEWGCAMVERLHIPVKLSARSAQAGPDRELPVLQVLVHYVLIPPGRCIHQRLAPVTTCTIAAYKGQTQ